MSAKPNRGRISNWYVVRRPDDTPRFVVGIHESGHDIRTSLILKIDAREGGQVETLNSVYDLGKPCPVDVSPNLSNADLTLGVKL